MMQINPYLHFQGNCAEAFAFYSTVLHGEPHIMKYADAPPGESVSDEMRDKVMHAHLQAGDAMLMGSDSPSHYSETPAGFSVSLGLKDVNEAERIFASLAAGGEVRMPIQQTFWAARFGMVQDKFGVPWMVNCESAA